MHPLNAPQCQCGHRFSTQFTPNNQTQAFIPGAEGFGAQIPPANYPRPGGTFDFNAFLLGLPPFVCFFLGFFVHVVALVLVVLYFGNPPTKSPQLGWATLWGVFASIAFMILFFMFMMLPAMFLH